MWSNRERGGSEQTDFAIMQLFHESKIRERDPSPILDIAERVPERPTVQSHQYVHHDCCRARNPLLAMNKRSLAEKARAATKHHLTVGRTREFVDTCVQHYLNLNQEK